jgi:hypothetical protein
MRAMHFSGQSISYTVFSAISIYDFVLQAKKLSENFVLPNRVKYLLIQLGQTLMICVDIELSMLQVGPTLLDC